MEDIFGLQNNYVNPLENFGKVTTYRHVNEAANQVRKVWDLGNGSNCGRDRIAGSEIYKSSKIDADIIKTINKDHFIFLPA